MNYFYYFKKKHIKNIKECKKQKKKQITHTEDEIYSVPADLRRHTVALITGKLRTNETAADVSNNRNFITLHTIWFLRLDLMSVNSIFVYNLS